MPVIPNNVDWSATAAWIALVISIVGTIIGPIVTALINNQHQLKILRIDLKTKEETERQTVLRSCISGIGLFLSHPNASTLEDFGKVFHTSYAFLPIEKWDTMDSFYALLISEEYEKARQLLPEIIHLLNEQSITKPR